MSQFDTDEAWNEASFQHDLLWGDPGRYASASGYDVIIEYGASPMGSGAAEAAEYVILNRTAVSVSTDVSRLNP